jgi:hypothetical protein
LDYPEVGFGYERCRIFALAEQKKDVPKEFYIYRINRRSAPNQILPREFF